MPEADATARDTSREARAILCEAQRRLGPARRVELAFEMCAEARRLAIAGMRHHDPALSESAAHACLLRRLLGDALFESAYPPDA